MTPVYLYVTHCVCMFSFCTFKSSCHIHAHIESQMEHRWYIQWNCIGNYEFSNFIITKAVLLNISPACRP